MASWRLPPSRGGRSANRRRGDGRRGQRPLTGWRWRLVRVWVANGLDGTVLADRSERPTSLHSRSEWAWTRWARLATMGRSGSQTATRARSRVSARRRTGSSRRSPWATARRASPLRVGGIWVERTRGFRRPPRAARFRVNVSADLIDTLDPALTGSPQVGSAPGDDADSKVGVKRVDGYDDGTIVADLATSVPTPTDDGAYLHLTGPSPALHWVERGAGSRP